MNPECKCFKIDVEIELDQPLTTYDKYIPAEAKHGDMIRTRTKYLRSLEVYFVNSTLVGLETGNFECKLVRELCQEDSTGSGYCSVPKKVTRKIKDPVTFYENAFGYFTEYSECDFLGIDIDTEVHQGILMEATGGRKVALDKECFYFFDGNEYDATKGLFVYVDEQSKYVKLTPDLDEKFL